MKKINSIIALLSLAAALSSCDFLNRDPSDRITEQEVFSKIETAEQYLNNAYAFLPDFQTSTEDDQGRYKLGGGTDEIGYQQSSTVTQTPYDFNLGNWNPTAMPMQRNWADYYGCIRRCNVLIKNYDLIPEEMSTGTSNRKERLLGEAYCLRGYFYFLLFQQWGGVPLITEPLGVSDVEELKAITRATAEETVQQILEDLAEAKKHLPVKHDDANFGRVTSLVCDGIKARLLLYWASPLWNTTNDVARWEEAAIANAEMIQAAEDAGHTLAIKYSFLFNQPAVQEEVIWCNNNYYLECYWWDVYAMPLGYGAFNVDGPLQEMVDEFEMKTSNEIPVLGYRENNTQILNPLATDYDPLHPWEGREDRFYSCILYHGAMLQGRQIDISTNGLDNINIGNIVRTNYFTNKYLDQDHNLLTHAGLTYRRFALLRTAEFYLNAAEAYNEFGGPTSTVYKYVNAIRKRAGQKDLPEGLSKKEMREKIRHERKIELCFENHRFWDVRRWLIAETVDNGKVHKVAVDENGNITYPVFQTRTFDPEKHYLFPIPQSEIDKNRGLEQNPGWE